MSPNNARHKNSNTAIIAVAAGFGVLLLLVFLFWGKSQVLGPGHVRAVHGWLSAQRNGESGDDYWHPAFLSKRTTLISVRGWEVLDSTEEEIRLDARGLPAIYAQAEVKVRIQSSNRMGMLIDLHWLIYLKKDNNGLWKIVYAKSDT